MITWPHGAAAMLPDIAAAAARPRGWAIRLWPAKTNESQVRHCASLRELPGVAKGLRRRAKEAAALTEEVDVEGPF
jgi:hypothetical protein